MAESQLGVFFEDRLVGLLDRQPDGRLAFEYTSTWLADAASFPVSVSLPLAPGRNVGLPAHAFFANLLPEGQVRQAVVQKLGLSESNDFELLKAIGGDCAGALSVLPRLEAPPTDESAYEPLSDDRLAAMARRFSVLAEVAGGRRVRLSLAGAQDKLPVHVDARGRLGLPLGGSPSSHILKVPSRSYKHLPANEVLTTRLARALGLEAIDAELLRVGGVDVLLARRYDRRVTDGNVRRLHQEDLCQALGRMPSTKYEQEGGPTFAEAVEVVRQQSTEPLRDLQQLLRWLIFGTLVGNADGHGKNLSLLYEGPGAARLAPFYDLVCTHAYPQLDQELAMSVGGRQDPGQIGRAQWQRLAAEVGIGRRLVVDEVERMATRMPSVWEEVAEAHRVLHGETQAMQLIRRVIRRRCRHALERLRA